MERISRQERTGATWRDLDGVKVLSQMNDHIVVDILNRDDSAAEFLDPNTWQMTSVRLPWDYDGTSQLRLARVDGEFIALHDMALDHRIDRSPYEGQTFHRTMADETLSIDDLSQQLDSEGMIGFTQSFVSDLERGFSAVDEKHLPWLQQLKSNDWNGILCFGMGGSAAGGDFLARIADASGSKPFIVHRGYQLPSWWTPEWLILATSHSGNTEETIAATESALKQGATVIVIATGGVLAGLCELHENCHLIPSIGGQPPRTAFGHLFSRQLALIEHLGLIPQQAKYEREAMLVRLEYACQANDFRNASGTPLLELAMALREHTIALLGPTEMQPALVRCKNQLNENSGRFARIGVVPEMNHNEIVAWGGVSDDADPARENQAILILTWDGMHPAYAVESIG